MIIHCTNQQEQLKRIKETINSFLQGSGGSLGLILKTNSAARELHELLSQEFNVQLISPDSTRFVNGISVTSIQMSKGLEFDEVLVPDVSEDTYHTGYDRSLLYIACTRAMHKLTMFYSGNQTQLIENSDVIQKETTVLQVGAANLG